MRTLFIAMFLLATGGLAAEQTAAVDFYGKVLGQDGQPVAARIFVRDAKVKADLASVEQSETNEDGVFLLSRTSPSPVDVYVLSEAGAPWLAENVDPAVPLVVNLAQGFEYRGVVRVRGSGEPIPGAVVSWKDRSAEMWPTDGLVREVKTDKAGRFLLKGLGEKTGLVLAVAKDRAQHAFEGQPLPALKDGDELPPVPKDHTFWLVPGVRWAGKVLDADDQPVAGAMIFLHSSDLSGGISMAREFMTGYSAKTEQDGSFRFPGLPLSLAWTGRIQHSDFARTHLPAKKFTAGKNIEDQILRIQRGAVLRWRCEVPEGEAVGTMRVVMSRVGEGMNSEARTFKNRDIAVTEEGQWSLAKVSAGRFKVTFRPSRWKPIELKEPIQIKDGEVFDLGTIAMDAGTRIAGRTLDATGEPVAGVTVSIRTNDYRQKRETVSDEGGQFQFSGMEEGPFILTAKKDDLSEVERKDVATDSTDLVLVMLARAGIRGEVAAEDGAPLEKVVARWFPRDESSSGMMAMVEGMMPSDRATLLLEEDGSFEEHSFTPGTGDLELSSRDYKPVRITDITLSSGSAYTLDPVNFERGLGLRGVVRGPDGETVAGAGVSVLKPGLFNRVLKMSQNDAETTGAEGGFEIRGLESGTIELDVDHSDYAAWSKTLTLSDPQNDLLVVEVRLGHGGALEGHVRDRAGVPVSGAKVISSQGIMGVNQHMAWTDEEGFYELDRLTEGAYTLILVKGYGRPDLSGSMTIQNAEVKEGETTIVDFDEKAKITLHGTVQRAGQPVADVRIMLIRGDGLSMSTDLKTAVADSYGNYEIGLDEPGTYQVRVRGAGGSMGMDTSLGALKIEVPDREKVEQNLILAETGFGGRVVDEDGNGIRGVGVHAMLEGGDVMQIDSQGSSSTDESGHFQISLQKPGLYEVRVSRSGFAPLQQPLQISDGFLDDVELVLTRGASVRGVVVDELGQPIVGAMVLPASASNSGLPVGEAEVTDGSGRFAITLGGDATVDLLAWQHGYADARVSAAGSSDAAGDSGITIVLTRGAALRVRVLDADGNPRAGQTVRLIPHNRSLMQLRMDLMMPGTTDSDGMARYEGLNPGSYQVLRLGREELEPTAIEISGTGDQEVTLIDPGSQ